MSSGKLNDCETCEKIKCNSSSNYSSDCDEMSTYSVGKSTLRLNFNQSVHSEGKSSKPITSRKGSQQQNKTFSSEKIREIERRNAMLVDRILYHSKRPNQYKTAMVATIPKVTSSEINRRRHEERIIRENEILLKKIQSVKPAVKYA